MFDLKLKLSIYISLGTFRLSWMTVHYMMTLVSWLLNLQTICYSITTEILKKHQNTVFARFSNDVIVRIYDKLKYYTYIVAKRLRMSTTSA